MRTFEWPIEDIVGAHADLYLDHHAAMAVAMMSRASVSPCEFLVECQGFSPPMLGGDASFILRVGWLESTAALARRVRLTEQSKPIIERAAIGLAALLFHRMHTDGEMRVADEGDRTDYWLPRLQCALEISGTDVSGELPRRQREKIRQVLANSWHLDGFVIVCCFNQDDRRIRWSFHNWEV